MATPILDRASEHEQATDRAPGGDATCVPRGVAPVVTADEAAAYAAWFKALADPTRIRILNMLARSAEPICVCDIVDHFALGQPTISHHLKILRDVRFVLSERRGTFMYYHLNHRCVLEFPEAARRIIGIKGDGSVAS